MMGQWTKQMGFPLITLKDYTPNPKDGTVALTRAELVPRRRVDAGPTSSTARKCGWSQSLRRLPEATSGPAAGDRRPEAGEADASPEEMSLMPAAKSYSMSVKGDGQWVKLNAVHVPLRVKYPDSMIPALCEAVKAKAVGAADRIGIPPDQAALTRLGLDPALYLQVLAATLPRTTRRCGVVLEQLAGCMPSSAAAPPNCSGSSYFARSLLLPKLAELGWTPRDSDGHLTRAARRADLCVAQLLRDGRRRRRRGAPPLRRLRCGAEGDGAKELPAEYQEAVYKLVLKNGGEKEFDQILGLFDSLTLNTARKAALQGLGAAPTDALRTRALEFAIGGKVKLRISSTSRSRCTQVASTMGRASNSGRHRTHPAHPARPGSMRRGLFKENLPKYTELYDKASASLMDAVSGACRSFATAEKAAEVKAFFAAQALPKNERTIAQLTESIETNAKYADAVRASKAKAWLEARG